MHIEAHVCYLIITKIESFWRPKILVRMKRISNTGCIEKVFIEMRRSNSIGNTRIDGSTTLIIDKKKNIMERRNSALENDF
jgi:hypothetical protein